LKLTFEIVNYCLFLRDFSLIFQFVDIVSYDTSTFFEKNRSLISILETDSWDCEWKHCLLFTTNFSLWIMLLIRPAATGGAGGTRGRAPHRRSGPLKLLAPWAVKNNWSPYKTFGISHYQNPGYGPVSYCVSKLYMITHR
jgi:hypothetical protein